MRGVRWTEVMIWIMLFATASGGRIDGKEHAQTDAEIYSEAPGS
jgi:hypothetical protein